MATDAELEKLQRADHDALIRVETKIDSFINAQADHEARLRTVESYKDGISGSIKGLRWSIAAVGAIAGIIEPFILFFMSKGQ